MYAGTLHEKFGINKLIEAYLLADLIDTELWIFGQGDYEEEVKLIATRNKRVKFKGSMDKKSILEYERQAILLVNPRPSNEALTKYSFPSKTLEYMLSGTPVLTTNLLGIPSEYAPYLYYFKKEDIEGMSNSLLDVLSIPLEERERKGELAKKYVIKYKNSSVQVDKILTFIQNIKS